MRMTTDPPRQPAAGKLNREDDIMKTYKIVTRDSSGHYYHVSGNTPLSALRKLCRPTPGCALSAAEVNEDGTETHGKIFREGRRAEFVPNHRDPSPI